MTTTIVSSTRISASGWRLNWSSDQIDPTFYVWQDGALALTTKQTAGLFSTPPDGDLIIEVFDSPDERPAFHSSGRITLGWYAITGANYYRIEENLDGTWTFRFSQPENGGWYYLWTSRYLEDCQTHNFRIVPVDGSGNTGNSLEVLSIIVRFPDIPAVNYSYHPIDQTITLQ